jgi:hypothetical protein
VALRILRQTLRQMKQESNSVLAAGASGKDRD